MSCCHQVGHLIGSGVLNNVQFCHRQVFVLLVVITASVTSLVICMHCRAPIIHQKLSFGPFPVCLACNGKDPCLP